MLAQHALGSPVAVEVTGIVVAAGNGQIGRIVAQQLNVFLALVLHLRPRRENICSGIGPEALPHNKGINLVFQCYHEQLTLGVGLALHIFDHHLERERTIGHLREDGFFASTSEPEKGIGEGVHSHARLVDGLELGLIDLGSEIPVMRFAAFVGSNDQRGVLGGQDAVVGRDRHGQ